MCWFCVLNSWRNNYYHYTWCTLDCCCISIAKFNYPTLAIHCEWLHSHKSLTCVKTETEDRGLVESNRRTRQMQHSLQVLAQHPLNCYIFKHCTITVLNSRFVLFGDCCGRPTSKASPRPPHPPCLPPFVFSTRLKEWNGHHDDHHHLRIIQLFCSSAIFSLTAKKSK